MSGAPLFTLVIFMKVDKLHNIVDVCVLFFNLFIYSSDFHEGRQYFITSLILVLNFAF